MFLNNIHIWHISLNEKRYKEEEKLIPILIEAELARANNFKVKHAKIDFILSRIALRRIASKYTNIPAEKLIFQTNRYGKPFLSLHPKLHFNLSHSHEFAVLVFSSLPIGIDIEHINILLEVEELAKTIFSLQELKAVKNTSFPNKAIKFFEIWTRKEALLKGIGTGFIDNIQEIDTSNLLSIYKNQLWQIQNFNLYNKDYIGHIAYPSKNRLNILNYFYPSDLSSFLI